MTFDYRRVRNEVSHRLTIIGRVDEEVIHTLYQKAISDELSHARKLAYEARRNVLSIIQVSHPEKGWVMVSREKWATVVEKVNGFVQGLAP